MRTPKQSSWRIGWQALGLAACTLVNPLSGSATAASLSEGLVAYWPLDTVVGTKTPDLASGYDMELANLTAADLVEGKFGKAFRFDNTRQTMLRRVNSPGERLPINQFETLTIAFWAKVTGTGQSDLRMFSEGSTSDNNPLFNLGTANTGGTGQVDFFLRQTDWATIDHVKTEGEPLDGTWRHLAFVQQADGTRTFYIDGVPDPVELLPKEPGTWRVNTTTIGGILRANPTHWLTGDLDEVILWSRALSQTEIQQVAAESLSSVFSPLTQGMVAYWPLDEVVGVKTPELVNGYDMELQNLSAADLVNGKWGKAFQFDNARQTLLRRIHSPGEQLPVNQHQAITISLWANVVGTGQSDLRLFSEGSTTDNNPLFNLGTANTGASGQLDLFIRQTGFTTIDHVKTEGEPLDGTWRHIVFVQQPDGARAVYIDGVRDPVELVPKDAGDWRVNTTTIGGILRANPTHWVTGQLDDVALWSRALSEDEIKSLFNNGTPTPFSIPQPLAIRVFAADLPAAAAGDSVTLRWDVTKNVQVTIDQGVGDVTAQTVSGLGSVTVPVPQNRTFTLTLTRGAETASATLKVAAISEVAEGWVLLDNFDTYSAGNIGGKGLWADLTATGLSVVEVDQNRLLAPGNTEVAAVLPRGLTITEGQQRTLFFRVIVRGDDAEPVRSLVAVTDRRLRFGSDVGGDVGPGAVISDEWDAGVLVGAANGFQAAVDFYEPVLEPNVPYNVWVDFRNGVFPEDQSSTGDSFSIHVQRNGTAGRTTILADYLADRNPVGQADIGFTGRDLDSLVVGGRAGHSTTQNLLIDDLYLSKSGYLATVPRAFGYSVSEDVTPPSLTVTRSGAELVITWSGGALEGADSVSGPWSAVAGATTSPFSTTAQGAHRFFRARQ